MFRIYFFIVVLFVSSACQRELLPSERIVTFADGDFILGHGYHVGDSTIITATHVADLCERVQCDIRSNLGSPRYIAYYKKESWNDVTYLRHPRIILDFVFPEVQVGDDLYALVSRSGGLTRLEGRVTRIESPYGSYDAQGVQRLYTGAIETDIVFAPGESGSPVWILSGELAGVVSAVDREKGRSYIVR